MQLLEQLNWRYATSKFDTDHKVSDDTLSQLLEAIRLAPSSFGIQPIHILVISDPEVKAKLLPASYNQTKAAENSHLLVFCARTDFDVLISQYVANAVAGGATEEGMSGWVNMVQGHISHLTPEQQLQWNARQTYISLGFALETAAYLGVDAAPMEGFEPAKYSEILELPSHIHPLAIMAIGYRAMDAAPRKKVRQTTEQLFDFR